MGLCWIILNVMHRTIPEYQYEVVKNIKIVGKSYSTALYSTALYSTALYSTALYCTVLYCTLRHHRELSCTPVNSNTISRWRSIRRAGAGLRRQVLCAHHGQQLVQADQRAAHQRGGSWLRPLHGVGELAEVIFNPHLYFQPSMFGSVAVGNSCKYTLNLLDQHSLEVIIVVCVKKDILFCLQVGKVYK